ERFVRPLEDDERERYLDEMNLVARLFGTPADVLPRNYGDFRAYFDTQLASDTITATAPARAVASVILAAPLPAPLRLLAPAHRLASAYLLPQRLREEYGLRWSPLHRLALPLAGRTVRYGTAPAAPPPAHPPPRTPPPRPPPPPPPPPPPRPPKNPPPPAGAPPAGPQRENEPTGCDP